MSEAKKITALKQQQKNKERVSVFLDGEYAFGVTMSVAMTLKKGQLLTDEDVARLKHGDTFDKAFHAALRYLGYRPRSQHEVETYLAKKEYDEEVVEGTIARLYEYGYLDDEAFARSWLSDRERLKPKGERGLSYELRQKGISDEVIALVLEELDEESSALRAVEPKLARWLTLDEQAMKRKINGFLGRRGFSYDAIRAVVEEALSRRIP